MLSYQESITGKQRALLPGDYREKTILYAEQENRLQTDGIQKK